MKRILLSLFMGWMALSLGAQKYSVSTEVQPRNVLLEEFTGIYCGYCPEGHAIAHQLKQVWGDRVSVVAVHCGPFAPADGDLNDLTVEDGHAVGQLLGATYGGFPSGSVNRIDWNGQNKLYYGRGNWEDFSRQILAQSAPVNLWTSASWNAQTRSMKIRVEGYVTEDVEALRLNLLLTQGNILAWQSGGNAGNSYAHQHVLRDFITDVKGDPLPAVKKGEYFVREYEYWVPVSYKKIAVKPADLDLVVFVTQGYQQVLQTVTVKPDYVGEILPLQAKVRPSLIPVEGGYRYNFVDLELESLCNSTLTAATFEVTLNGVATSVEWQGEVLPFKAKTIRIPVDWNLKAVNSNQYRITLKALNGEPVPESAFEGHFEAPVTLPKELTLHINTDEFAEQNTYSLYDMDGNCLQTFGPFENGKHHDYKEKLPLRSNARYCLEVTDAQGNGIYPHGNAVEFVLDSGLALYQLYAVKNFGVRLFFQTGVPSGIEEVKVVDADNSVEVYDLLGKRVTTARGLKGLPRGVYLVRQGDTARKVMVR